MPLAPLDEVRRRFFSDPSVEEDNVDGHLHMHLIFSVVELPVPELTGYNRTLTPFGFQSSQFYDALKGDGVPCRLVSLPFERHHYAARESVVHVIWETDRWLEMYCASNSRNIQVMESSVYMEHSPTCQALALYLTKMFAILASWFDCYCATLQCNASCLTP
ncbi:hypothetical protein ABZP36_001062 [Zizania latifolia]